MLIYLLIIANTVIPIADNIVTPITTPPVAYASIVNCESVGATVGAGTPVVGESTGTNVVGGVGAPEGCAVGGVGAKDGARVVGGVGAFVVGACEGAPVEGANVSPSNP